MFDSDPPEFVYGIDLNNNDVPDFRENDDKPDYPYPRDQKGRHLFLRFNRIGVLGDHLTLGYYLNRQIAGGGRARSLYLRYESTYDKAQVGQVKINYDLKKVEDDIQDHTYLYVVPPEDIDGLSMLPTLLGKSRRQRKHRFLYWEFHEQGKKQAIRMGDWKGVRLNVGQDPDGPIELYHLDVDPGETTDLASDHPEIVAQIAGLMRTARTPSEHWSWP